MAGSGEPKTGGRQSGTPNHLARDVRAMLLAALDRAGGEDYLLAQANNNPRAFLTLVGRLIPSQLVGKEDAPLMPAVPDSQRLAMVLLAAITGAMKKDDSTEVEQEPV